MSGKIFISYRRADTVFATSWIYDRLKVAFGPDAIFMDHAIVPIGARIDDVNRAALDRVDVVLVIIGPGWLAASNDRGRRLDDPNDFVRLEIASAFRSGKLLIPVLVGNTAFPRIEDLPEELKLLDRLQRMRIRTETLEADVAHLIDRLGRAFAEATARRDAATKSNKSTAPPESALPPQPAPPQPQTAPSTHTQQPAPRSALDLRALLAKARSAAVALLRRVRRTLPWLAAGTAATVAATYGLAIVALETLEPPALRRPPMAAVRTADVSTAPTIGGHAAPIRQASLIGGQAITVDADGAVRATRTDGHDWRAMLDLSQPLAILSRTVRRPYIQPVADLALAATAQLLLLYIPEAAQGRRGRAFRDCKHGVCSPEMVEITPGAFLMGAPWSEVGTSDQERPRRLVTVQQPFAVSKFEVTFDDWAACVAGGGCQSNKAPSDEGWGRGRRPVINVSWANAQECVAWLAQNTGQPYRLLTEVEWEYAARAGTTTPFSFGVTISTDQANYDGDYTYGSGVKGLRREKTIEVGSLQALNAFGLHDMHGNVWEWVEDCWIDSYKGAPFDGSSRTSCPDRSDRVIRGGSWVNFPESVRAAFRDGVPDVGLGNSVIGFRLVKTLPRSP